VAQKVARELIKADPELTSPEHNSLKQVLEYKQLEQNRI
jgi:ATP-dependent DNA helicase RecG